MPRNDELPPETSHQQDRRSTLPGAAGGRHPPHPSPPHRVLHFEVPIIDGRVIVSVDSHGLLPAARAGLDDGPVLFVDIDTDGNFLTDYPVPGEPFESLEQLIRAAGVHLLTASRRDLPRWKEEDLVAEPLQELDLSSLSDLLNTTALDELSITPASSSSSLLMEGHPWRCLSSSPIWALRRFDWGITFYTRIDLKGSYHTYPHVGGPFRSLQEAHNAIDRYLQEHQDQTMFTQQPGVSQLDMVVRQCLNWPDGTRKKLLESQQIDERRDCRRQLVQALVDKYNDYHHLMGDFAYKLKDVVLYKSVSGGNDRTRLYDHINFTMKTKGAEDSNCGIDDLFFAEVSFKQGEYSELVLSCFCMVKPTDNGHCYGCDVKHPNDAAAYTAAGVKSQRTCPIFGNMKWKCRDQTLEEEERRVRSLYEGQGLDSPDYLERVKEEMTIKPFSYEEQQHVGSAASSSSQTPVPELQHLHSEAFSDLPCNEELLGETASAEILQERDVSLNTATLDELSITAASSSSVQSHAVAQDTIEVPPPPWRCLSSSPILVLNRYSWGYSFYIRIDLKGLFHTYPRVGGPFQSLQEAHSAIDRYLQERQHPTMFMDQPGVSRVEIVVRRCLYWPDGTRKRRMESQPIDENRDSHRQLAQALVDKYNEYNHVMGEIAYEVKDVVRFQSVHGASDNVHYHINFTAKTKGADDSTCVIDDLFFAELTYKRGQAEYLVSCFCTVKPTDNGCCHGCDVKHPNDAAAYTGGQVGPLGECAKLGGMEWTGYYESLEEEEARVRRIYEGQGRDDPDYV